MITLYFRLFINFFSIGLFSVGGGLATLPFLYDLSDRTGWFTHHDLMDILAVSESTPGAIGVNMSTYVGFITCSVPGSVIATLGLIMPSIIVILIIARILEKFRDSDYVTAAFHGLKPASIGLICAAGVSVAELVFINSGSLANIPPMDFLNLKAVLLGIFLFILMRIFKNVHPAVFIGFSAVIGIIFSFAQ